MSIVTKAIFPAIAGGLLATSAIVASVTGSQHQSDLETKSAELEALNQKIAEASVGATQIETTGALSRLGASPEKVAEDTDEIEELAERALTWDDHASYTEAREATMRAYDLDEASTFMKSFLAPAPVNIDSQGNEYPYIDAAGLNSRVGGVGVRLLEVDGLTYSYLALVDVQSLASDGLGTATNVATIFITIDGDGAVTELSGFAATKQPVHSP